jgi:hypothetical protein
MSVVYYAEKQLVSPACLVTLGHCRPMIHTVSLNFSRTSLVSGRES